jgi:hypothetical protein
MVDNVDDAVMEDPELLDVNQPYLQVELMPEAIHFLLPKSTIAEKQETAPG